MTTKGIWFFNQDGFKIKKKLRYNFFSRFWMGFSCFSFNNLFFYSQFSSRNWFFNVEKLWKTKKKNFCSPSTNLNLKFWPNGPLSYIPLLFCSLRPSKNSKWTTLAIPALNLPCNYFSFNFKVVETSWFVVNSFSTSSQITKLFSTVIK